MPKKNETFVIELTSAIVLDGELITAGDLVEVTEKEAKNLLARGKGFLTEQPPATGPDLNDMTVDALRKIADDLGVEGYRELKKVDLIKAIEAVSEAAD